MFKDSDTKFRNVKQPVQPSAEPSAQPSAQPNDQSIGLKDINESNAKDKDLEPLEDFKPKNINNMNLENYIQEYNSSKKLLNQMKQVIYDDKKLINQMRPVIQKEIQKKMITKNLI